MALINRRDLVCRGAPGRRPLRVLGVDGDRARPHRLGLRRPRRGGLRGRVGPVSLARANRGLSWAQKEILGTLVLLLAAAALAATGQTTAAVVYAVVVVVNAVALFAMRDDVAHAFDDVGRG